MGLGNLANSDLVFKRKYRWAFEVQGLAVGDVPSHYVKLAARPNLAIDETEINFLHGTDYLPGKGKWESINVTYYDTDAKEMKPLWDWLASVYNFTDSEGIHQASTKRTYAGRGVLKLFDGCGNTMEVWELYDLWPTNINFGELDYSSSDVAEIELTLRYSRVEYQTKCGPDINPVCGGCGGIPLVSEGEAFRSYRLLDGSATPRVDSLKGGNLSSPLGVGIGSTRSGFFN